MEKTVRTEGKTTTEAIEKGLKELGVSKDKVEIKVADNGNGIPPRCNTFQANISKVMQL